MAWVRRFVRFHGTRHPRELGEEEVTRFLTHLAVNRKVSASTQNQVLSAVLFLYRDVMGKELSWLDDVVRARRSARLPVVLTRAQVTAVLGRLEGAPRLMASLLYGSGLRLMECARLRVKDIDLERGEVIVRDGKGQKDRVTLLPESIQDSLRRHLERVRPATSERSGPEHGKRCILLHPPPAETKYFRNSDAPFSRYWRKGRFGTVARISRMTAFGTYHA